MKESIINIDKFEEGKKIIKENIEKEDKFVIGFETEYSLIDKYLKPAMPKKVEKLISINEDRGTELGSFQIETRTKPIINPDIKGIYQTLKGIEDLLIEDAKKEGLSLLRIGALPNLHPKNVIVTNAERYHKVPDFHDKNRRKEVNTYVGGIDFSDCKCIGLFNSVQINVQAKNEEDGIDKLNRSLMIGPYISAICGNARIINGKDTGFNDIRLPAWETSHDIRKSENEEHRVGLPNSYYKNLDDYFGRIKQHPLILDTTSLDPASIVRLTIGLNWKDTRLKLIKNNGSMNHIPVVEFRLISTQPTLEEDLAAMLFYLGRLAWSQKENEELLPFEKTRFNRNQAIKYGLNGFMYNTNSDIKVEIKNLIKTEIEKANDGLRSLGFDPEAKTYLDLLSNRKYSPSEEFAEKVKSNGLENGIKEYLIK